MRQGLIDAVPFAIYAVFIAAAVVLLMNLIGALAATAALLVTCSVGTALTFGPLQVIDRLASRGVKLELAELRRIRVEDRDAEAWQPSAKLLKALADMPLRERVNALMRTSSMATEQIDEFRVLISSTLEDGRGSDEDRIRNAIRLLAEAENVRD